MRISYFLYSNTHTTLIVVRIQQINLYIILNKFETGVKIIENKTTRITNVVVCLQTNSMMYESTCSYQSALDLKRVAMSSPPNIKTENDCLSSTTPQWPSVGVASCAYR